MKIVIILPTYNERENIEVLLDSLRQVLAPIRNHQVEYLVVDDTSPDGTADVVRSYRKKNPNVRVITGKKEGLGKALLRGMDVAIEQMHADYILTMDADLSHDPRVVPKFIEALDGGASFVVGCRYISGGSIPDNWGLHRKIYSIVGNAIVRFGLGFPRVHDWTGGFRAFHKKYYEILKDKMSPYRGYVFQIAFLHNAILSGASVVEVPIHFTDRRFGRSKIAPSEYIRNVLEYVATHRVARTARGSFGKFLVVGSIGFIINTVILELLVGFGFHPSAASAVGAELAIISNFIFNNSWTFADHKVSRDKRVGKFLQFNTTSLGALVIQAGAVWVGTHLFGISVYRIAYMVGVGIGLVWNYSMYSKVIWKKHA